MAPGSLDVYNIRNVVALQFGLDVGRFFDVEVSNYGFGRGWLAGWLQDGTNRSWNHESERERERDRDCERLREIERDPPTLVIIKEMNEILLLWFLKKTHRVEEREVSLKRT